MFRKFLIVFLMTPLFAAALATGASFPMLMLMLSLLLIALVASSARDGAQE
jgi:hypothetical protein